MTKQMIDRDGKPVEEGKWYCIGFMRDQFDGEPQMQWGSLLKWNGDGWLAEDDERVTLFDCDLNMNVADDAADAYACQS